MIGSKTNIINRQKIRSMINIGLFPILLLFLFSGPAASADVFDPSTIYSLPPAWGTGSLFNIDQDTWTETDEVPIYFADDPAEGVTGGLGLAVNPLTGEYYAIIKSADDAQSDPGYLTILNVSTGEAQRIGQFSTRINSWLLTRGETSTEQPDWEMWRRKAFFP